MGNGQWAMGNGENGQKAQNGTKNAQSGKTPLEGPQGRLGKEVSRLANLSFGAELCDHEIKLAIIKQK
jgi:hypothetical protein